MVRKANRDHLTIAHRCYEKKSKSELLEQRLIDSRFTMHIKFAMKRAAMLRYLGFSGGHSHSFYLRCSVALFPDTYRRPAVDFSSRASVPRAIWMPEDQRRDDVRHTYDHDDSYHDSGRNTHRHGCHHTDAGPNRSASYHTPA
jgi:hypothetical protein